MKYISKIKYNKVLFSLIINVAIFVLFFSVFGLHYEMADDAGYAQFIVDGCYDFIFINYIYASIVGFIQNIIYPFNAYVIVFLVLSVFAFTTLTVIFMEKFNYVMAVLFTLFINGFFAINHYSTTSFSRMPTLLTVTGFLAILHYVNKQKWIIGTIIGIVFVVLGSLIRFEIFEVSLVMVCVFVFAKTFVDYYVINKTELKTKKWILILFEKKRLIIAFITVILCFSLNYSAYCMIKNDEGLSHYWEYTCARSAVWDYAIPDYEVCENEYEAIDVDKNDINMLRSGYYDSNGGMTLQKLNDIHNIQEKYKTKNISYTDTIINMISSELGNIRAIGDKGIASLSFILIFSIFLITMKKKNYVIPLLLLIPVFFFYTYLWVSGKSPFRAVYILWFSSVVYTCYSFSYSEFRPYLRSLIDKHKNLLYILAIFTSIVVSMAGFFLSNIANDYIENSNYNDCQVDLKNYIEQSNSNKFELARSVSLPTNGEDIFHIYKTDTNKNYQEFSCTYGELPYTKRQVNNFGTDNLYSYLLENKVYFVDNDNNSNIDMIDEYLNKYYVRNKKICHSKKKSIGNYTIYKFIEK